MCVRKIGIRYAANTVTSTRNSATIASWKSSIVNIRKVRRKICFGKLRYWYLLLLQSIPSWIRSIAITYHSRPANKLNVPAFVQKFGIQFVANAVLMNTESSETAALWRSLIAKTIQVSSSSYHQACSIWQKSFAEYIKVDKKLCEEPPRTTTNCPDVCSANYKPVCGKSNNDYRVFSNACYLAVHNCRHSNSKSSSHLQRQLIHLQLLWIKS